MHILLVDDNLATLERLEALLERLGHEVVSRGSKHAALAAYSKSLWSLPKFSTV